MALRCARFFPCFARRRPRFGLSRRCFGIYGILEERESRGVTDEVLEFASDLAFKPRSVANALPVKPLGHTGFHTSSIVLGLRKLSSSQKRPRRKQAIAVIHEALDLGVTAFDTADVFCIDDSEFGHNEVLLAEALDTYEGHADTSRVLVIAKGGLHRPDGVLTHRGGKPFLSLFSVSPASPDDLRRAVDGSLHRLNRNWLDLFLLHTPDPNQPIEPACETLSQLQHEGLVRWVGLSNVSRERIAEAAGIVDVQVVQNKLNVFQTESLHFMALKTCQNLDITFMAHSPAGGERHAGLVQHPFLLHLATKYSCSPYQVALNVLNELSRYCLPVCGATQVHTIRSIVDSLLIDIDKLDLQKFWFELGVQDWAP